MLAEPHPRPGVLDLGIEVHGPLDVDQHGVAAAVEQDMVGAELAVDERRSRARLDRPGQRVQRFAEAFLSVGQ